MAPAPRVPSHIEQTVATIFQVHNEHRRRASRGQRIVSTATAAIGRPVFVAILTSVVVSWIGLNLGLRAAGHRPLDPPPFTYLAEVASLAALYLAAIILATQKHDDELATDRDQLTLQLAILSEQKSAKIIRLLEELRRSDPGRRHHADDEADAMAVPADPQAMLEKLRSINHALGGG